MVMMMDAVIRLLCQIKNPSMCVKHYLFSYYASLVLYIIDGSGKKLCFM